MATLPSYGGPVTRWVFRDLKTGEQATVPLNPNAMTSPYPTRKYTYNSTTAGPAGTVVTNEGHPDPVSWQWSGDLLDRRHFDFLLHWSRKQNRIRITDHFLRQFVCLFDSFQPIPKRGLQHYWRHTYTCACTVYSYVDAPGAVIL